MNAIELLEKNRNKIDWLGLSSNPNAIGLLENNIDRLFGYGLSENSNATTILNRFTYNSIYWFKISQVNTNVDFLESNQDKLNWLYLSENPVIFTKEYDYERMKKSTDIFKEELMAKVFHPRRFERYLMEHDYDMNDL